LKLVAWDKRRDPPRQLPASPKVDPFGQSFRPGWTRKFERPGSRARPEVPLCRTSYRRTGRLSAAENSVGREQARRFCVALPVPARSRAAVPCNPGPSDRVEHQQEQEAPEPDGGHGNGQHKDERHEQRLDHSERHPALTTVLLALQLGPVDDSELLDEDADGGNEQRAATR